MSDSIFCDFLTVTYSPLDSPVDEARRALISLGGVMFMDDALTFGDGTVKFADKAKYSMISFTGGALDRLRSLSEFEALLALLGSSPHSVTRLDVARDVVEDTPVILSQYYRRYKRRPPAFGRKAARIQRTTCPSHYDGRETGTISIGNRRSAVYGRIYDKRQQLMERNKSTLGDIGPCTRYELELKIKQGERRPSLRDAALPESIYWHFAVPTYFEAAPDHVEPWNPSDGSSKWEFVMSERLPYAALERFVESHEVSTTLAILADACGPEGRSTALRMLKNRLEAVPVVADDESGLCPDKED